MAGQRHSLPHYYSTVQLFSALFFPIRVGTDLLIQCFCGCIYKILFCAVQFLPQLHHQYLSHVQSEPFWHLYK